jgi:cation:H+ antiporter
MMGLLLWIALVIVGIGIMQWGAAQVADVLETACSRWKLPATATGALMGVATAGPEISVNVASVSFGWPDLGLGTALGSNVPALPLAILLSYLSSRLRPGASPDVPAPQVRPQAVEVQAIPYLGVVVLLAALTLPPPISGLQWVDGVVVLVAFGLYFSRALLRKPPRNRGSVPSGLAKPALLGMPAIALGGVASTIGAQKVGAALGIPDIVTGLFVIGFLCVLPESYSAWRFTRNDKPTIAVAAVMSDGIVSLTVALLPGAFVGTAVGNIAIYMLNLGFLAATLVLYIALNNRHRGQKLGLGLVLLLAGGYCAYLAATVVILLRAS